MSPFFAKAAFIVNFDGKYVISPFFGDFNDPVLR